MAFYEKSIKDVAKEAIPLVLKEFKSSLESELAVAFEETKAQPTSFLAARSTPEELNVRVSPSTKWPTIAGLEMDMVERQVEQDELDRQTTLNQVAKMYSF